MNQSQLRRRAQLGASLGSVAKALGQDRPKSSDPWTPELNEKLQRNYSVKNLVRDRDTGMEVLVVRYPAGLVVPMHTHPCAHGMYVLQGSLVTHEGRYSPGSFVWFPEGLRMEHGATAEEDVTVLFVTNKPFGIQYV